VKNIALIGMPACGKSTVGVVLAKVMRYRFVDTDILLQEEANMSLNDLLKERGLDGFISFENSVISSFNAEKTVISTGGSAVYGSEAMANLKNQSIVVYLKERYDTINSRLNNMATRGVAIREGYTLLDLYNERIPLYEKYADVTIEADNLSIEEAVMEIQKRVEEIAQKPMLLLDNSL
jgi:shikimate kinase